jgi:hypothetical protein
MTKKLIQDIADEVILPTISSLIMGLMLVAILSTSLRC